MMVTDFKSRLEISEEQIADFCRRHHISRFALFGSILRDDFNPDSDIDVLVKFEPGHVPGLKFFGMERELSNMAGRKVDLNTLGFLSERFRDRVLQEAEVLFELRGQQSPPAPHAGSRQGSSRHGAREAS